jgi:hypothetical protein
MSFAWIEYLALARYLQHHVNSSFAQEAALRCAVSRAYYAAYCHSRNYARDHQGFIPSNKGDDHGRVRVHFQKRGDIMVAASLDRLRQWRNACDYDDTVSAIASLLTSAIAEAQKIFSLL